MTGPNNDRYRRRFTGPEQWPSNGAFADRAVEDTRRRVNELSWALAGEQVADEAARFLRAHAARELRRRTARSEGWQAGEPGE